MKIEGYIHASYCEYEKKYNFQIWGHDMSGQPSCGPLVEKVEVEFTPPPHEVMVKGTIAQYREQQKRVMAEAERLRNELEQRINDLLCIEYKPETVAQS